MKKATQADLRDMADIMEALVKDLPNLNRATRIDVCARVRAIVKQCEKIDEIVKEEIKKTLRNKDGELSGELFKAKLGYHDETRFDSKRFKADRPNLYNEYCDTKEVGKITFEVR